MRSPSPVVWLLLKEGRALASSRAWWVMLGLTGPLVGMSFIPAVRTYGEISAGAGVGCGAVCAPLTGIWAPTFSAYELIAIFVLPFVAIHLASADRLSGALKIELQRPFPALGRVVAKALVLMAGCLVAGTAALAAMALWRLDGGAVYLPELFVVAFGHLLNAALTIALASAAAALTEHPSTAAILTLAVTVGAWVLAFVAALNGGLWQRLASATPPAMVATFERGLVEARTVVIAVALIAASLVISAIALRSGVATSRRALEVVGVAVAASLVVLAGTTVRGSWDASLSRQNSFPEAADEALERVTTPLSIEVHLAPEDPRRIAFEASALPKLERAMPHVAVTFISRTSTGLYEQADPGYGEIWYALGEKRVMGRATTDEGVLETIFGLLGGAPADDAASSFRGQPLVARVAWAPAVFFGAWPLIVAGAAFVTLRRHS